MDLAAITYFSQHFRPRKSLQRRTNPSHFTTWPWSLKVANEKKQAEPSISSSPRKAVLFGPVGLKLRIHYSRQSIKPRPSSHSTHLQVQRHLPLKTSPHFTSVLHQQNSACSFHISRSRAVYCHFCALHPGLQHSPPFFVMIVGSHCSRIVLT